MRGLSFFAHIFKKFGSDTMNLRLELKNGTMTAALSGDIDHHAAARVREEIDRAAEQVRPHTLRMDFSSVPFMDSSGIGLILGRVRLLSLWQGGVTVSGLSPQLRRMAELSGVGRLTKIEDGNERKVEA